MYKRQVQGRADRQAVQDAPDDGLLDVDHLVAGLVVVRRPVLVDVGRADRAGHRRDALGAGEFRGVQQSADLGRPGLDEGLVGGSLPEAAQQGGALQSQQIAERAQVGHPGDGTDAGRAGSSGFPAQPGPGMTSPPPCTRVISTSRYLPRCTAAAHSADPAVRLA